MTEYRWSKYFIPPFHNDEICVDTIWDSAGNRTTTSSSEAAFKGTADAHFKALAAAMNAKMNGTELPAKMSFGHPVYEGTQCDAVVKFKADGEEIELDVRGWVSSLAGSISARVLPLPSRMTSATSSWTALTPSTAMLRTR